MKIEKNKTPFSNRTNTSNQAYMTPDNKRIVGNSKKRSTTIPLFIVIGFVLLAIFGYLFFASFDWSWESSHHSVKHHSFTEYGMNLHHDEVTDYHNDYSFLKWLFYPVDIIMLLIGAICLKLGINK